MWSRAAKWSTLKLNDGGRSCGVEDLNRAERIYEMCGAKQWRTWTAMKWLGLWVMLMRCLQPKKKKENERTVCIPWSDHPCPLTSAIVCIVVNKPRRYVSVDMRFGLRALFFFGSKFDLGILCFWRVSLTNYVGVQNKNPRGYEGIIWTLEPHLSLISGSIPGLCILGVWPFSNYAGVQNKKSRSFELITCRDIEEDDIRCGLTRQLNLNF